PLEKMPQNLIEFGEFQQQQSRKKASFFDDNNKFLHYVFSSYMIENYNIAKINGQLHIYEDGVYKSGSDLIRSRMLSEVYTLKKNQREETLDHIYLTAKEVEEAPPKYINLKNGIFNLETNELIDHTPKIVMTSKLNASYNPNAKDENVDKLLDTIGAGNEEIIQLLKEVIGYT